MWMYSYCVHVELRSSRTVYKDLFFGGITTIVLQFPSSVVFKEYLAAFCWFFLRSLSRVGSFFPVKLKPWWQPHRSRSDDWYWDLLKTSTTNKTYLHISKILTPFLYHCNVSWGQSDRATFGHIDQYQESFYCSLTQYFHLVPNCLW